MVMAMFIFVFLLRTLGTSSSSLKHASPSVLFTVAELLLVLLSLHPVPVYSQDATWEYPNAGLVINYNDVIISSWRSTYEYPGLILWGPNAAGTAVVEWTSFISAWTNGTYAYTFTSALGGRDTYPFSAHFQLMRNTTTTSDGVNGDVFTVTSTSGLPKTYAYTTTLTQTVATSTLPLSTATSGISSNAAPFTYVGCYTDDPQDRTLRNELGGQALGGSSNMTVENCATLCNTYSLQQYTIMGVEYGNECFCDISIFNPSSSLVSESECDTLCTGNSAETCGGNDRLNVYAVSREVPVWSASITGTVTSPAATAGATTTTAGAGSNPTTTSTDTPGAGTTAGSASASSSSLSTGAEAGIGVGVGLGVAFIAAIAGYLFWKRRGGHQKLRQEQQYHNPPPAYEDPGIRYTDSNAQPSDMRQLVELPTQQTGQQGVAELGEREPMMPVELPLHQKR